MTLLALDWGFLLEKAVLIIIILTVSLVVAMYETYAERKIAAWLQDRVGPNRAGPWGIFQPLADGGKLFFKEEIIPNSSNKFLFILGPSLAMLTAMMTCAVIPWGDKLELGGRTIRLQIADINVAMLYIFAVVSVGVYGIMIGGWSSNNKFSLLAALRGASQVISYELAMGLSLISLIFITGSLSLRTIVEQQMQPGHLWNVVYQPVGFLIFFVCALAECNRAPFDLPEAESELNMGYHQEYSSMKLGFYLFAEYINMFISSVIMATVFFGGYALPLWDPANHANWANVLVGILALGGKVCIFIFFFMWIRWSLPRFRYDQLMNLGWKGLIPLALTNMVITGAVVLYLQNH